MLVTCEDFSLWVVINNFNNANPEHHCWLAHTKFWQVSHKMLDFLLLIICLHWFLIIFNLNIITNYWFFKLFLVFFRWLCRDIQINKSQSSNQPIDAKYNTAKTDIGLTCLVVTKWAYTQNVCYLNLANS